MIKNFASTFFKAKWQMASTEFSTKVKFCSSLGSGSCRVSLRPWLCLQLWVWKYAPVPWSAEMVTREMGIGCKLTVRYEQPIGFGRTLYMRPCLLGSHGKSISRSMRDALCFAHARVAKWAGSKYHFFSTFFFTWGGDVLTFLLVALSFLAAVWFLIPFGMDFSYLFISIRFFLIYF